MNWKCVRATRIAAWRAPVGLSLVLPMTFALVIAGCSKARNDGRPQPVPVSGKVVFEGKPISGAVVAFAPQDHTYAATARTDAEGAFKLQTFDVADGAVPGKFRVVVYKVDVLELPGGSVRETHHLPVPYRNVETTKLEVVVLAEGKNDVNLELVK